MFIFTRSQLLLSTCTNILAIWLLKNIINNNPVFSEKKKKLKIISLTCVPESAIYVKTLSNNGLNIRK